MSDEIQAKQEPGKKFDKGKAPIALLPTIPLFDVAHVLYFGAYVKGYGEHNWRKGMSWSRLLSAAMRHIMQFNAGEDHDPETGRIHLAHAICCLMFVTEYYTTHPEFDDRHIPTDSLDTEDQ